MKKGYRVFGKAYQVMFRNDLHDKHSIDHYLLRNMILLDNESNNFLYGVNGNGGSIYSVYDLLNNQLLTKEIYQKVIKDD